MRKLRYREGKGSCLRKVVGETELKSDVSTPKLFLKTFAPGVYLQDDGLGGTFSFFLSFFCIMCKKRSTKAPLCGMKLASVPPSWWIRWRWASRSWRPSWNVGGWGIRGCPRRRMSGNWWKSQASICSPRVSSTRGREGWSPRISRYLERLSRLLPEPPRFSLSSFSTKKGVNPSFQKGPGIICRGVGVSS